MQKSQLVSNDYVTRIHSSPLEINATQWNGLLGTSDAPTPFMRHEYLAAMHTSGSAVKETGWDARFVALYDKGTDELLAACPLYSKPHSYGEYVFDFAWARAYQEHGLAYYPKATIAVPFTPVPGSRFLCKKGFSSTSLLREVLFFCEQEKISSVHALFASDADQATANDAKLMLRETVQFHWTNIAPTLCADASPLPPEGARAGSGRPSAENIAPTLCADASPLPPEGARAGSGRPSAENIAPTLCASASPLPPEGARAGSGRPGAENIAPTLCADASPLPPEGARAGSGRPSAVTSKYESFNAYLATLAQDKRKKIRAERRKVSEAGVSWRWSRGADIASADWDFFYRCYERTYLEHGNAPYLTREFFQSMQTDMPENWLLFIAEHGGKSIACSLIAIQDQSLIRGQDTIDSVAPHAVSTGSIGQKHLKIAYGRYWGALARVDSLHFEACYYQPLQWCIDHGFDRFEGGAQGEHKMARGLLPVVTRSAHWLAHPQFADAVNRFLERETNGIGEYVEHLAQRNPFRLPAN